jgi:hypothetical protein
MAMWLKDEKGRGTYRTKAGTPAVSADPAAIYESESVIAVERCRLIELSVHLSSITEFSGSGNTGCYLWIFDAATVLELTSPQLLRPAVPPAYIDPGGNVSWSPPVEWTPFERGIVAILNYDDLYLDQQNPPTLGGMNVYARVQFATGSQSDGSAQGGSPDGGTSFPGGYRRTC